MENKYSYDVSYVYLQMCDKKFDIPFWFKPIKNDKNGNNRYLMWFMVYDKVFQRIVKGNDVPPIALCKGYIYSFMKSKMNCG